MMIPTMILRGILKACIVVFCIWHMIAVGIYAIVSEEGNPLLEYLVSKRHYVRPYILATSQWQRWNLFSPDPLRRVTYFYIDSWQNFRWEEIHAVTPETLTFFQRAPELKMVRRLEKKQNLKPLREVYLKDFCTSLDLVEGKRLRLRKRYYVIPRTLKNTPAKFWREWEPEWNEVHELTITCPQRA